MKPIIVDIIGGAGAGGDTKPAKKFYARKDTRYAKRPKVEVEPINSYMQMQRDVLPKGLGLEIHPIIAPDQPLKQVLPQWEISWRLLKGAVE